jgi:hypothetical protein
MLTYPMVLFAGFILLFGIVGEIQALASLKTQSATSTAVVLPSAIGLTVFVAVTSAIALVRTMKGTKREPADTTPAPGGPQLPAAQRSSDHLRLVLQRSRLLGLESGLLLLLPGLSPRQLAPAQGKTPQHNLLRHEIADH